MKKLLFICSKNKLRSPTAENIFSTCESLEVRSAGLEHDADIKVSTEDIEWADIIFLMENCHRDKINKKFGKYLKGARLIVLGIPDNYKYMEESLVEILKKKVSSYVDCD